MLKSSGFLLNIRLCLYSAAIINLVIVAVIILPIDTSNDADPRVRAYISLKWRLLTVWFNLISLAYFPVCIYCDWMEKRDQGDRKFVATVRKIKDLVMTSILFPTIMFGDTLFWSLWHADPGLIAPVRVFEYMPDWSHHSLHTVSMIVITLDLILVPRRRPETTLPNLKLMMVFLTLYNLVLSWSYRNGEIVYTILAILNIQKFIVFLIFIYIGCLFYFTTQWCIIDFVWGHRKSHYVNVYNKNN